MTAKRCKYLVAGIALGVFICGGGIAQADPWGGAGDDFEYSNGGDNYGHYGVPVVYANTLYFPDVNFAVNASNGGSQGQDDTLSFDMDVNPGLYLGYVTVSLFGGYGLTGEGSMVDLVSNWAIEERAGLMRTFDIYLDTEPIDFPLVQGPGPSLNGIYSGTAEANLSYELPSADPALHVEMTTDLLAEAVLEGTAALDATYQQIAFEFVFIPEPGTLMLLGLGGLALLRRRR